MVKFSIPEIILVNTQIPENLGATARAMLNFKLSKLRLVSPCFDINNEKILPLSAGATKVLKGIKNFKSFEESIKDFNILIATTNRMRSIKKKQINFKNLNKKIKNSANKVGIVFGPEKSGLDNNHISMCDFALRIDSNPNFSSLNLSHAVSLVAYEIMKGTKMTENKIHKNVNSDKEIVYAPKTELLNFFSILEYHLEETNFFLVKERKKVIVQKIRSIFNRLEPTSNDISTLLGIIKSLRKNNQK